MEKLKIVLSSPLPGGIPKDLMERKNLNWVCLEKHHHPEDLIRETADAWGLISLLSDSLTSEFFGASARLQWIAQYAVGLNNIDLDQANSMGITISNTPGVLTDATAELTLALLMAAARYIPQADQFLRRGDFKGWDPELFLGLELKDAELGIIGHGRIGKRVEEMASALGMKVNVLPRHASPHELREFLGTCQFLSLHIPLTGETHHLIGEQELSWMRPKSVLINTSRGEVVDENALCKALNTGHLSGAGLDVFEREPKVSDELLSHPGTVLLPHIGSATLKARGRMAEITWDAVRSHLESKKPKNQVSQP